MVAIRKHIREGWRNRVGLSTERSLSSPLQKACKGKGDAVSITCRYTQRAACICDRALIGCTLSTAKHFGQFLIVLHKMRYINRLDE